MNGCIEINTDLIETLFSTKHTKYGHYHAFDEDARSHSTDEEYCLVESNAYVVVEGLCVFCRITLTSMSSLVDQ